VLRGVRSGGAADRSAVGAGPAEAAGQGTDAPPIIKPGEEYRRLYKEPKTIADAYGAIQFEIELGSMAWPHATCAP